MEMTKQRKVLACILATGVAGLAMDRLLLGPPEAASADALSVPDVAPPEQPADGKQPDQPGEEDDAATLPSYASLTERLVKAQSSQALQTDAGDPFALPEDWRPKNAVEIEAALPEPEQPGKLFLQRNRLDATVSSGSKKRAVVNGREMVKGERLEDYTLVEIGIRWAVWESAEGNAVVMHVPDALK